MEKEKIEIEKPAVLYVDDEASNLTAFSAAFRRYYKIYTAGSAREGIEILRKNPVDLIITDQRMPEMTGVQFLEALMPDFPDPVRMILTGFSDIEAIIKAINNGAVLRYIVKPWDVDELKQIIDIGIKIHNLEKNNHLLFDNLKVELDKQKKLIELFKKYVPLDIVNQIVEKSDKDFSLDSEFRIISVLFADIRHFTKLSENVEPRILVSYLNHYFSTMVNCVIKHEGTVYKFLGDGLLVLFGAPVSSMHNQRNAVMCALDMCEVLKKFNKEHSKDVNHQLEVGIGIATGDVMVCHISTEHFLSYTALGKTMDLAFQTEALTHDLPNGVLIEESTYSRVKDDVQTELFSEANNNTTKENVYKVIKCIAKK